jgi:hypothetical protein
MRLVVLALAVALVPIDAHAAQGPPPPDPTRSVIVEGDGAAVYPAFDPTITRYGVTTTAGTGGSLTVTASTSDPAGSITVDGRPVASGEPVDVEGLADGDEVTVRIDDSGGATSYALVYLPADFPTITTTSSGTGPEPGATFLTLNGTARFEAAVDEHGVPVHVRAVPRMSNDFQLQADGRYSVARQTPDGNDVRIWALDETFEDAESYQTAAPLTTTDFHDAVFHPDGRVLLMAYDIDSIDSNPVVNSVIQELAPDGSVSFLWNSADHIPVEDGLVGQLPAGNDYAHLNSLQYLPDGDLLASFRNTSQVLRIAGTAHDGFQPGDVVWRLGGVHDDFTFVDDPFGGFCAQHTARLLADGHLLVWDNGSDYQPGTIFSTQTGDICPNPAGPEEPRVGRSFSRAAEYDLDLDAMTATLVWQSDDDEGFTRFGGSAQRLPGGHTLLGRGTDGTVEVDEDGEVVWTLHAGGLSSYRSQKFEAPDAIEPTADVVIPADASAFAQDQVVEADYGCTDAGGSTLQTCDGPVPPGGAVDTSTPGLHEFTVTATDGAGNTTTVTHTYEVAVGAHQPDGVLRRRARGPWVGNQRYTADGTGQRIVLTGRRGQVLTTLVRFQDDGTEADAFRIRGSRNSAAFQVRYLRGDRDVTAAIKAGTFTTPELAPGAYFPLRVEVTVKRSAPPGATQPVRLTATSVAEPAHSDSVVTVARATP